MHVRFGCWRGHVGGLRHWLEPPQQSNNSNGPSPNMIFRKSARRTRSDFETSSQILIDLADASLEHNTLPRPCERLTAWIAKALPAKAVGCKALRRELQQLLGGDRISDIMQNECLHVMESYGETRKGNRKCSNLGIEPRGSTDFFHTNYPSESVGSATDRLNC